jgi:8-oxo-dGTP diphosphatase
MASPIHTVGALLVRRPGQVLLGMRARWKKRWPSHWDAIGGHVEGSESFDVALVREVHEEIGVMVSSYQLLRTTPGDDGYLHHIYAVTAWSGEPQNRSDEHDEISWFDVEALKTLGNLAGVGYPELAALAWAQLPHD